MATKTLAEKMKLKPGSRALILQPPEGFLDELSIPEGVELAHSLEGKFDWLLVFVQSSVELAAIATELVRALNPASLLWISFPKGTSGIQTDLTRDKGWDSLAGADLKWINLVSVNQTWSAFSLRPYRPGEARQSFR